LGRRDPSASWLGQRRRRRGEEIWVVEAGCIAGGGVFSGGGGGGFPWPPLSFPPPSFGFAHGPASWPPHERSPKKYAVMDP
jgi:hypothetical protein